jgi:hypothetical protein
VRELLPQLQNQPLLLRETQADVHDVRRGRLERVDQGPARDGVRLETERREVPAGNQHTLGCQSLRGALRGKLCTAQQEHAPPLLGRRVRQREDERRTRNASGQRRLLQTARPDNGHSVGEDIIGVLGEMLIFGTAQLPEDVDVRRDDVATVTSLEF